MRRFHKQHWCLCALFSAGALVASACDPGQKAQLDNVEGGAPVASDCTLNEEAQLIENSGEAEAGGIYKMPEGDRSSGPRKGGKPVEIPAPGDEYSDEERLRLKQERPKLDPSAPPVVAVDADKECPESAD